MPIDASIPLQVRPPQFEDPTQAYGRMLSLRNLQQESQQRQQLAPLVYQQQAAAAQSAQLQVQQQKLQADIQQRLALSYQQASDEVNAKRVHQPPATAASPAQSQGAVPPPAAAAPVSPAPPAGGPAEDENTDDSADIKADASTGSTGPAASPNPPQAMPLPQGQPVSRPAAVATAAPGQSPAWQPVDPGFHDALIRNMFKNNLGARVPGIVKQHADMVVSQAKAVGEEAKAHQALAEQATQLLQGIQSLQPEDRDAEYQKVLPRIAGLETQMGADPAQLPRNWDDKAMGVLIANGYTAQNWSSHLHQVSETARLAQEGIVQNAPKAAEYMQQEVGNVTTPEQYNELRQRISTYAQAERKANPNGQSYWQTALDSFPKQWNRGVSQQALLGSMKPQERVPYLQKSLELTTQRLAAAAALGPDAYTRELGQTDPTEAGLFPTPEHFDLDTTPDTVRKVGLTAAQASMADFRDQRMSLQDQQLQLMRERLNFVEHKESPTQHKAYINNLAEEAYLRSGRDDATGSPDPTKATYDRAIADVQNPNLYSDHPIGDVRGEVADALRAKQGGGLRNQRTQGQIDKDGDLEKFLLGGQTPTAKPGTGKSTPPATTQKATPPAAQAKPAGQQMTEADARAKAIAAGKDADWYVGELRKRKLLK